MTNSKRNQFRKTEFKALGDNGVFHDVFMYADGTIEAEKVIDGSIVCIYDWTGETREGLLNMFRGSGHEMYTLYEEIEEIEITEANGDGTFNVTINNRNEGEVLDAEQIVGLHLCNTYNRATITYDPNNEDLEDDIRAAGLFYYEIDTPKDEGDEGFHVLIHRGKPYDGEIEFDIAGRFEKDYKTYRGAVNYTRKHTNNVIES